MRPAAFSNFRPPQAAVFLTAPWDLRPKIRGDRQAAASDTAGSSRTFIPGQNERSPAALGACLNRRHRGVPPGGAGSSAKPSERSAACLFSNCGPVVKHLYLTFLIDGFHGSCREGPEPGAPVGVPRRAACQEGCLLLGPPKRTAVPIAGDGSHRSRGKLAP